MKLSERMNAVATKKRIRTPAIWTILKDYADEVAQLEAKNEALREKSEALLDAVVRSPIYYEVKDTYHWVRIAVDALLTEED